MILKFKLKASVSAMSKSMAGQRRHRHLQLSGMSIAVALSRWRVSQDKASKTTGTKKYETFPDVVRALLSNSRQYRQAISGTYMLRETVMETSTRLSASTFNLPRVCIDQQHWCLGEVVVLRFSPLHRGCDQGAGHTQDEVNAIPNEWENASRNYLSIYSEELSWRLAM